MQAQLDSLNLRLKQVESNQVVSGGKLDRIEANTSELISILTALKGAWTVLNFLGKLAKPVGLILSAGGAWWWLKDHAKELFK